MGWSGYELYGLMISVDAHAGEREERGERLFEELRQELESAIKGVIDQPKYRNNQDAIRIYE